MRIAGLQKMTLLDYPGKVACTIFLDGCNFRCPFCHNGELVTAEVEQPIQTQELLQFLKKRRGLLEGVCITGGEPTLYNDLPELLRSIRSLGYPVKLDTNGYLPEMLKALVGEGLLDYVAMDLKNCPARYAETAGCPELDLKRIEESARFLLDGSVPYEFRTTVVEEFHDESAILNLGRWIEELGQGRRAKALYLQPYVERDTVLQPGLHSPDVVKLRRFQSILEPFADLVELRGTES